MRCQGPIRPRVVVRDAQRLAEALGIGFEIISINTTFQSFQKTLSPVFEGMGADITEENLQARLRGDTLMALSNKFGALVLTTGNKSELAVGYCTLYGDMVGGLAADQRRAEDPGFISSLEWVISATVTLSRRRYLPNRRRPNCGRTKRTQIRWPEYEVLDPILKAYVEEYKSPAAIAEELNLPLELVRDIAGKVNRNEYKRQQAAPGLRVTSKAFGVGRRFPIAQRFTP